VTNIQWYLAHNIREFRAKKSLTQEKLAELVGTSGNYIAQIERGEKYPSAKMVERIAESLETDSSCLFCKPPAEFTNPWN